MGECGELVQVGRLLRLLLELMHQHDLEHGVPRARLKGGKLAGRQPLDVLEAVVGDAARKVPFADRLGEAGQKTREAATEECFLGDGAPRHRQPRPSAHRRGHGAGALENAHRQRIASGVLGGLLGGTQLLERAGKWHQVMGNHEPGGGRRPRPHGHVEAFALAVAHEAVLDLEALGEFLRQKWRGFCRQMAAVEEAQGGGRLERVLHRQHGHHVVATGVDDLAVAHFLHYRAHQVQRKAVERGGDAHMPGGGGWAEAVEVALHAFIAGCNLFRLPCHGGVQPRLHRQKIVLGRALGGDPCPHAIAVHQEKGIVALMGLESDGRKEALEILLVTPALSSWRISQIVDVCRYSLDEAVEVRRVFTIEKAHQATWQGGGVGLFDVGERLLGRQQLAALFRLGDDPLEIIRQRQGVGGDDEAAAERALAFPGLQAFFDLSPENVRPQPLGGADGAEVIAPPHPALFAFPSDNPPPEGGGAALRIVLTLLRRPVQMFPIRGQPFALAAQGAAIPFLRRLLERAHRLGRRLHAGERGIDRRIEQAGIGPVAEDAGVDLFGEGLPEVLPEDAGRLVLPRAGEQPKERFERLARLCQVLAALRPRHRRPVHLGETVELRLDLLDHHRRRLLDPGGIAQARKHLLAQQPLHLGPRGLCCLPSDLFGLRLRHDGNEQVGQGGDEQRVEVRLLAPPVGVDTDLLLAVLFLPLVEQPFRNAHLPHQPRVHLRHAAQMWEDHRIGAEAAEKRLHGREREVREQMRAGPKIGGGAGLGDEILYRADRDSEQGKAFALVGGEGPGNGRGEVEMGPDRMIRHPRIRRQQPPQVPQPLRREGLLGQEPPEREQGAAHAVGALHLQLFAQHPLENVHGAAEDIALEPVEILCGLGDGTEPVTQPRQRMHQFAVRVETDLWRPRPLEVELRAVGGGGPVIGLADEVALPAEQQLA